MLLCMITQCRLEDNTMSHIRSWKIKRCESQKTDGGYVRDCHGDTFMNVARTRATRITPTTPISIYNIAPPASASIRCFCRDLSAAACCPLHPSNQTPYPHALLLPPCTTPAVWSDVPPPRPRDAPSRKCMTHECELH